MKKILWTVLLVVGWGVCCGVGLAAGTPTPYKKSIEECRKITQEGLRQELLKISRQAFEGKKVNFHGLVERQWIQHKMDQVVEHHVTLAAKQVNAEYGYFSRLKSSFSKTKAKEMAEKMARYAFASESFRQKMQVLSKAIAGKLNEVIHERAKLSINRSIECINQFLKSKYTDVVKEVFRSQLAASFKKDFGSEGKLYQLPSVLGMRSKGMIGVGILLMRQIVKRLAKRIAKRIAQRLVKSLGMRIATRIGSKFIPWVGWGLLLWDVWDLARAKGAIPEIERSLKLPKVKARMKMEMSTSIKEAFESNYRSIVRQVSDTIYGVWENFRKRFHHVLRLADKDPTFRQALRELKRMDQLYVVVRLYGLLGEKTMRKIARNGHLLQLVENPMRAEFVALLRHKPDVQEALAWYRLAGLRLRQVVMHEIYKHKRPHQLDDETLKVLLSLPKSSQVSKMLLLPKHAIIQLGAISKENRKRLVSRLSTNQLRLATRYLTSVAGEQRNQLISLWLTYTPKRLSVLEKPQVTELVMTEPNKLNLVRFFVTDRPLRDIRMIQELPLQAYFIKYGRWAYYALLVFLVFFLPLGGIVCVWFVRYTFGTTRLLARLLLGPRKEKS